MNNRVPDLKNDILKPIAAHIKKKKDSLIELARFKRKRGQSLKKDKSNKKKAKRHKSQ